MGQNLHFHRDAHVVFGIISTVGSVAIEYLTCHRDGLFGSSYSSSSSRVSGGGNKTASVAGQQLFSRIWVVEASLLSSLAVSHFYPAIMVSLSLPLLR